MGIEQISEIKMNKRRKVIIFDGDDTLWQTQKLYDSVKHKFKELMESCGFKEEEIIKFVDEIDTLRVDVLKFSKMRFPESLLITYAFLCGKYNKNWDIHIEKIIRELSFNAFTVPKLYDDTIKTIETLSKYFDLVLFTAGDKEIQKKKIDSLGKKFKSYFSKIYIHEMKNEQHFRRIMQGLKIPAHDIWSVGNSIKSDINLCLKLGARAILIPRGGWKYEESDLLPGDVFIANSLTEACNYILEQENLKKQELLEVDLKLLELILQKSWSRETCYPSLQKKWSNDNPALGQCAITALIVQDYFGGELLYCKHFQHYWNKLPDGKEVDLTKSQFPNNAKICFDEIETREFVLESKMVEKEKTMERYTMLKKHVENLLNKKLKERNSYE